MRRVTSDLRINLSSWSCERDSLNQIVQASYGNPGNQGCKHPKTETCSEHTVSNQWNRTHFEYTPCRRPHCRIPLLLPWHPWNSYWCISLKCPANVFDLVTSTCDLWPLYMTLTSISFHLTVVPKFKSMSNPSGGRVRQTDRQTDTQTDRQCKTITVSADAGCKDSSEDSLLGLCENILLH